MTLGVTNTFFAPLNTMIDSDRNYGGELGGATVFAPYDTGSSMHGLSGATVFAPYDTGSSMQGLNGCGCGANPARYGLNGLDALTVGEYKFALVAGAGLLYAAYKIFGGR